VYVYLITNLVNGKYYVGQTVKDIVWRWTQHKSAARRMAERQAGCLLLNRAINKYGASAFVIEELARAQSPEQLNVLEQLWIAVLDSANYKVGYNRNFGGAGCRGTFDVRKLISDKAKEQFADPAKKLKHDQACAAARRFVGWTTEERRKAMARDTHGEKNPAFGKPGTRLGAMWSAAQRVKAAATWARKKEQRLLVEQEKKSCLTKTEVLA
jgi:group I intron endonuclease